MQYPRSVATHDGPFHADEVTACALLILYGLVDPDKVVRSRDPQKLHSCEYVCDVGGIFDPHNKRFDHHQVDYQGPLSSAGMVAEYLKDQQIASTDEYDHLRDSLIIGVDAHDNGKALLIPGWATFSMIIANFVPIEYTAEEPAFEAAFRDALQFTLGHLRRLRERFHYNASCRAEVKEAMDMASECLIFDRRLSWIENFFALGGHKHPASFVIMPAGPHWKLRCIPPDWEHRMETRIPLPEEWAGLLEQELKAVSGIPGAIFCHKGRFISVWETKEDALRALHYTLEQARSRHERQNDL